MSNGSQFPGDKQIEQAGTTGSAQGMDAAYIRRQQERAQQERCADAKAQCVPSRRLTARELLDREIVRLEQQVGALRLLSASLPLELPYPADQVLCDMITALARRA